MTFQGVDPTDVESWSEDEVMDALAVIDELNRDAKRRERASR